AQTVVLTDFRTGAASASAAQLDRDLAGALAATAVAVGAERAAAIAARSLTPEVLGSALRHLHKPALDPAVGRALKDPPELAERAPPAGRPGGRDRSAGAGPAPPGELGDADHGGRLADRRLGPDRRAHRRVSIVRHRHR